MLSGTMSEILKNTDLISAEREHTFLGDIPYVRTGGIKASAEKTPIGYRFKMKIAIILLRLGGYKVPIVDHENLAKIKN